MFYQSLQANGKTTIFVVFKHLEGGQFRQPATFLCQRFRLTIAKIQTLFVPSKYLFVF